MKVKVGSPKEMGGRSTGDQPETDRRTWVLEERNAPSETPDPDHDDCQGRGDLPAPVEEVAGQDESADHIVSFVNISDDDDDLDDDDDDDEDDDEDEDEDDDDDEDVIER